MIQEKSATAQLDRSNGKSSTNQQTYTYQEVLEASKTYFNGDELGATTWK